jgi:hypothetical protein
MSTTNEYNQYYIKANIFVNAHLFWATKIVLYLNWYHSLSANADKQDIHIAGMYGPIVVKALLKKPYPTKTSFCIFLGNDFTCCKDKNSFKKAKLSFEAGHSSSHYKSKQPFQGYK